jgi:hypothetical protein
MVPIPEGSEAHSEESSNSAEYRDMQEMLDQPSPDLTGSGATPGPAEGHVAPATAATEQAPTGPLQGLKVEGACELSG